MFIAAGAADLLVARVAARIKAAESLPGGRAGRTFCRLGNRAGLDISKIEAPRLIRGLWIAAAGEGGHAPIDSSAAAERNAAKARGARPDVRQRLAEQAFRNWE